MFDQKIKNITAFLSAAAILVAGGWTVYTYDFLQLREQRSINVTIKASQVKIPGDRGRYVCALVELTNAGKDPETFFWPSAPIPAFTATRVSLDKEGALVTGGFVGVRAGSDLGVRLLPGQVQRRVFLARVDEPGLYYLEFKVPASSKEQYTASKKDQLKGDQNIFWADAAYIAVE